MNPKPNWIRLVLTCAVFIALLAGALPPGAAGARQAPVFQCSVNPLTSSLLAESSQESWVDWVARLTGERPVMVAGRERTITTRYSAALFNGQENALAYDYILETLRQWYPDALIEEDEYEVYRSDGPLTWKNLVLSLPGQVHPEQSVLLTAHLDSTSSAPTELAPGADDNAGGAAALLEAARLLRARYFERTIRLIWFTGEEQVMLGSRDYVNTHNLNGVVGVINMDMFSYDADGDRCFELHVGTLPQSDAVGRCFTDSIAAYNLNLSYDYFNNSQAIYASDHSSFWGVGIGAVEVGENFRGLTTPGGCGEGVADQNPNYHHVTDRLESMNVEVGFALTQAALASISQMAVPLEGPVERFSLFLPFFPSE